jgi:uncharacterized membrane protein
VEKIGYADLPSCVKPPIFFIAVLQVVFVLTQQSYGYGNSAAKYIDDIINIYLVIATAHEAERNSR